MISSHSIEASIPKEFMNYISAQAQLAYSKINKTSCIDVDDLIAMGMMVYFKALDKWNPEKSKFDTFLINCLKNDYYKTVRDSFTQRRGGLGTQYNNGKEQTMQIISNISIDYLADNSENNHKNIQLIANEDTDVEYGLLLHQICKKLPKHLRRQFAQMTDPDKELIDLAHQKSVGKGKCDIDDKLMAEYLGIPVAKVRENKLAIKSVIGKFVRV
jgi:DNA-directed RNA polymerase specialized sigma24 family protein